MPEDVEGGGLRARGEEALSDLAKINERQAKVNSGGGLTENGHDDCISGVRAGELHVVGFFVRGNALQDELAGIGVLAFIPLQVFIAFSFARFTESSPKVSLTRSPLTRRCMKNAGGYTRKS